MSNKIIFFEKKHYINVQVILIQSQFNVNFHCIFHQKKKTVCWVLSKCFLFLSKIVQNFSKEIFWPNSNLHAIPIDLGITFDPMPLIDNITDMEVVVLATNVENDIDVVDNILQFVYFSFDWLFSPLKQFTFFTRLFLEKMKLFLTCVSLSIRPHHCLSIIVVQMGTIQYWSFL